MVQRVRTSYISDLSGQELAEDQVVHLSFGWEGTPYEIDLSAQEADELRATMQPYLKHARPLSRRRPYARSGQQGSGRTPAELATIRAWARDNGFTVADTGRVARAVIDAYDRARPQ